MPVSESQRDSSRAPIRVSTTSTIAWRKPETSRLKPLHVLILSEESSHHGGTEKIRRKEVREGGRQAGRVRDAPPEEGNAAQRARRKRREGKKPQAGDSDRTFRGARERSEGPAEEDRKKVVAKEDVHAEEIVFPEEELLPEEKLLDRAGCYGRTGGGGNAPFRFLRYRDST